MKCRILLAAGLMFLSTCVWANEIEKTGTSLDNLVKVFEQNPSDPQVTVKLLEEMRKQGKPAQDVLVRYFQTQKEEDYCKNYNWAIIRDYVTDLKSPQLQYVFKNCDKFIEQYSRDDVFGKLDNVLVNTLEPLYRQNKPAYEAQLQRIKDIGYEHYDVVYDYFYIRQLYKEKNAEDYFYKARKLFRYFPENRPMIKKITAGALDIMHDVSRLKVIQLWAGKTVESQTDFDAIYNYVVISEKCGYEDVAKKYASIANALANKSNDASMKARAGELTKLVN